MGKENGKNFFWMPKSWIQYAILIPLQSWRLPTTLTPIHGTSYKVNSRIDNADLTLNYFLFMVFPSHLCMNFLRWNEYYISEKWLLMSSFLKTINYSLHAWKIFILKQLSGGNIVITMEKFTSDYLKERWKVYFYNLRGLEIQQLLVSQRFPACIAE